MLSLCFVVVVFSSFSWTGRRYTDTSLPASLWCVRIGIHASKFGGRLILPYCRLSVPSVRINVVALFSPHGFMVWSAFNAARHSLASSTFSLMLRLGSCFFFLNFKYF